MQSCDWLSEDDPKLFEWGPSQRAPEPSRLQASGTALVFDTRMELHADAKARPHPERPDRIRAVVARLMASGLAGVRSPPSLSRLQGHRGVHLLAWRSAWHMARSQAERPGTLLACRALGQTHPILVLTACETGC